MKSMKKLIFVICICILSLLNVNAKEVTNKNGTFELTEKEYKYAKDFYGDNYFKRMTAEDYKRLKAVDVDNRDVEIKKANQDVLFPNDTSVASSNKGLMISRACTDTFCLVSVYAEWYGNPTVRSWDVIGVRFAGGASLYSSYVDTRVGGDNTSQSFSNYQNFSNGFGNSVKLPDNDTGLYIELDFYVNPTGYIYATYQHAMRETTLETSKSYTISVAGYGKVLVFDGPAYGVYDGFAGVDMKIN